MTELVTVIQAVARDVLTRADELNSLDAQAGDGDLGVTMATAGRVVLELLPGLKHALPGDVLRACGLAIAREAPSTSGTLLATGLLRAGSTIPSPPRDDPTTFAILLDGACAAIAQRGKATPGSKTMLDALAPAVEAAQQSARASQSLVDTVKAAADAADAGARATVAMQPRFGRAGWLPERSLGHEDAGARLVAIILASATDILEHGASA